MNIYEFKTEFDGYLKKFLLDKIDKSESRNPSFVGALEQGMKISLSGGKRIRPYLIYLAYNSTNKSSDQKINPEIKNLCLAIEIFHIFCLIHDDIMDNDEKRHNEYTIHNFMKNNFQMDEKLGKSVAILIGDLYHSYANELISEYSIQTKEIYNKMTEELVYGQFLDIQIETISLPEINLINEKTLLKTANYTFTRPLELGFSVNNCTEENFKFANDFGNEIGFAYQVQDDLLSIMGEYKDTGKNPLSDIQNGQHTIFTDHIFKSDFKNEFNIFFGKEFTNKDIEVIREIFKKSGAIEYGTEIINNKYSNAKKLLDSMRFENKDLWNGVIEKLEKRI